MPKEKMQVTLKSYFKPEQGQRGMSQGSYVITGRGEFKCYNSGPQWFGMNEKGQVIEVNGEWKQSQQTQQWYLTCSFGQAAQGPPQSGPPQSSQNPPQGVSRAAGGNKDRLIVAQVVYKALAALAQVTPDIAFDVWLMGDGKNVFKRHADLIMQIGAGETPSSYQGNPHDEPPPEDDDIPF